MTEVRPLRAYAEVVLGRQRSPTHDSGPFMVPYLRAANVKDGELDLSDVKEMNFSPSEQAIFSLTDGDVLVTEGSGSLGAVGASAVWNEDLPGTHCFQNTLLRLRPRPGTDSRFLAWWARYAFADGLFASVATGANIFHVSAERVRSLPMTYLPLPEQRAIADYLDRETARIDALIAAKQRTTSLLAERWRSQRSHAILQGCDPVTGAGVPPARCNVRNLGATVTLQRGHDLPSDSRIPGDVPVVSSGGVSGSHNRAACLPPGVVTGRYGTIGSTYYVDTPYWPLNTTLFVSDFRGNWPRWVFHMLAALPLSIDEEKSAVTGINRNVVGALRVPVPPVAEQRRLADLLDAASDAKDAMATRVDAQIDLLRERRQALITAAVTGQIEVPVAA